MKIAFYAESEGPRLVAAEPPHFIDGHYFYAERAIVWTESDPMEEKAARLIINTKPRRFTFLSPRLVQIRGNLTIYSATESEGASGTLQALKKRYILIGHDT